MSKLSHIPEQFRKEFTVDAKGRVTASRRAVARLAGVENTSVNRLLEKLSSPDAQTKSRFLEPYTGKAFEPDAPIPDLLAAAIINYYAYEAGRYCTEQAKDIAFAFSAIGFRTWVQQELGWKSGKGQSYGSAVRLNGKVARRSLTDAVKDYIERHRDELSENSIKWMYSNLTNGLYLKTHKLKASQLMRIYGCKKEDLRDCLPQKELITIETVEDTATRLVDQLDMHPLEAIKEAVERTLATHLFCDSYAEAALALKEGRELPPIGLGG